MAGNDEGRSRLLNAAKDWLDILAEDQERRSEIEKLTTENESLKRRLAAKGRKTKDTVLQKQLEDLESKLTVETAEKKKARYELERVTISSTNRVDKILKEKERSDEKVTVLLAAIRASNDAHDDLQRILEHKDAEINKHIERIADIKEKYEQNWEVSTELSQQLKTMKDAPHVPPEERKAVKALLGKARRVFRDNGHIVTGRSTIIKQEVKEEPADEQPAGDNGEGSAQNDCPSIGH